MRTRRGVMASCLLSALFLIANSAVDPATAAGTAGHRDPSTSSAHGEADEHSREHMAEDLVGTPIRVIEQKTAANATRIRRETGVSPGTARTRAAVVADPGRSGSWS